MERALIDLSTTECGICHEQYANSDDLPNRKPRVLDCGHHYCTGCLSQMQKVVGRIRSIHCPECKERTRIKQSVNKLPLSRGILDVIQSSAFHRKMAASATAMDSDPAADPAAAAAAAAASVASSSSSSKRKRPDTINCCDCETNQAYWYCSSCRGGVEFCDGCWNNRPLHRKADTSHHKQPINNRPQTPPAIQMCHSHARTPLDMFCKADQTITCAQCHLVGAHKGHEVIDLKSQIDATASLLQSKQADLEALETSLSDRLNDIQAATELAISQGETRRLAVLAEQKQLENKLQIAVEAVCTDIKRQVDLFCHSLVRLQQETTTVRSLLSESKSAISQSLEDANIPHLRDSSFLEAAGLVLATAETAGGRGARICASDDVKDVMDYECESCASVQERCGLQGVGAAIDAIKPMGLCIKQLEVHIALQGISDGGAAMEEVFRLFERVGTQPRANDVFTATHEVVEDSPDLADQSKQAVLHAVHAVLSNQAMLSDQSELGKARVIGALYCLSACTSLENPIWETDMSGLKLIAAVLEDATQPQIVVELALSTIVSPIMCQSVDPFIAAGLGSTIVRLLRRFRDSTAIRTTATRMLCMLCQGAKPKSLRGLIADGAVLALVQSLQRPCDHHLVYTSNRIRRALQRISTVPQGKAALCDPAARKAFNIAFRQRFSAPCTDVDSPRRECSSIAALLFLDDSKDPPLTTEVTELLGACMLHIRSG